MPIKIRYELYSENAPHESKSVRLVLYATPAIKKSLETCRRKLGIADMSNLLLYIIKGYLLAFQVLGECLYKHLATSSDFDKKYQEYLHGLKK